MSPVWIAALQPVIVGGVLIWAGLFKLTSGKNRLVGVAELVVATGLLAFGLAWPAVGLTIGFLGYLAYKRKTAPGSSCGCTSARRSPIGWRHFSHAGLLLLLSGYAVTSAQTWWQSIADRPIPSVGILLAEAALVLAVNPDGDRFWLLPLRRWRVRLTHPLAAAFTREVPLHATVQQLQRSPAYRKIGRLLRSDVVESWEEGEWRLLRYTLRYQDRPASAVFAVPRETHEPIRVRAAIVDEADQSILYTHS